MCCGDGSRCGGLTADQVAEVQRQLAEAFDLPRLRYDLTVGAMLAQSRAALAANRAELACGLEVTGRGGSVEEYLACRVDGQEPTVRPRRAGRR